MYIATVYEIGDESKKGNASTVKHKSKFRLGLAK